MCKVFFDSEIASTFAAYAFGPSPAKKAKQAVVLPKPDRVETIKRSQTAQISRVLIEQNCGFLDFEGEELFFHGSQLIGCVTAELKTNDSLKFDIVYNPRTGKFLAKTVSKIENPPRFQDTKTVSTQIGNAEIIKRAQTAQVSRVIAEQNCGFVEYEGEQLFFHENQLQGCTTSELKRGDTVSFNVVYNPRNGKFLAKSVSKIQANRIRGHFQMMETAKVQKTAEAPSETTSSQGKITEISAQHGFIDTHTFFHTSQLIGTHISELKVGDCLAFNSHVNSSGRKVATNVTKTVQQPTVQVISPELAAVKSMLELEGARGLLRRLSQAVVINDSQNDREVEGIMQRIKVDALAGGRKASLTPFSDANSRINSRRGSAIGFR
jgi:cold shock CspA family protein